MHNKPVYQKIYLLENTSPNGRINFKWNAKKNNKILKLKIKGQHNSVFFNADAKYTLTTHKKKTVIKDICVDNICYKTNDELEFSDQTENYFLLYDIDCSSDCEKRCLSSEELDPTLFIKKNLERIIKNESVYNECEKTVVIFNIGVFNKLSIKFKIIDEPRCEPEPCPNPEPKPCPKPCPLRNCDPIIYLIVFCILFTIFEKNTHMLSLIKKIISGLCRRLL